MRTPIPRVYHFSPRHTLPRQEKPGVLHAEGKLLQPSERDSGPDPQGYNPTMGYIAESE
jgi:hypothetical protein